MLKDPKYAELVATEAWQEHFKELKEGYREWLLNRKIEATHAPDVTTEEGLAFLNELEKVIKFITEEVKPIPADPDKPYDEQYRRVKVATLFDDIDITIVSHPRKRRR